MTKQKIDQDFGGFTPWKEASLPNSLKIVSTISAKHHNPSKRSALPPKSDQDQVLQSCIVQSMCNLIWNLDKHLLTWMRILIHWKNLFTWTLAIKSTISTERPTNIYPSNRTILSQLYHLSALVIQCSSWRTEGCRVKGLEERRREKEEEREEKGFRVDNCVGATPVTL